MLIFASFISTVYERPTNITPTCQEDNEVFIQAYYKCISAPQRLYHLTLISTLYKHYSCLNQFHHINFAVSYCSHNFTDAASVYWNNV